ASLMAINCICKYTPVNPIRHRRRKFSPTEQTPVENVTFKGPQGDGEMFSLRRCALAIQNCSPSAPPSLRMNLQAPFSIRATPLLLAPASPHPAKPKRSHRVHAKTPPAPRHCHFSRRRGLFFDGTKPNSNAGYPHTPTL